MKIAKKARKFADAFQVRHARSFRLKDHDPGECHGIGSKEKADELLQQSVSVLQEMQEKLYAQNQWQSSSSSRPWTPPVKTAWSSM